VIGFGNSVSISADGHTAAIAAYFSGNSRGDTIADFWVFTFKDGTWVQVGAFVANTNAPYGVNLGPAAISGDSGTVVLGGTSAGSNAGYVFVAHVLGLVITDSGNFTQAGTGAFTLTVSNKGPIATNGSAVSVYDAVYNATATGLSGPGWNCSLSALRCSRYEVLQPGASFPPIIVNVSIPSNASTVGDQGTAEGGGAGRSSGFNQAAVH
jgi:hypothetical protein